MPLPSRTYASPLQKFLEESSKIHTLIVGEKRVYTLLNPGVFMFSSPDPRCVHVFNSLYTFSKKQVSWESTIPAVWVGGRARSNLYEFHRSIEAID